MYPSCRVRRLAFASDDDACGDEKGFANRESSDLLRSPRNTSGRDQRLSAVISDRFHLSHKGYSQSSDDAFRRTLDTGYAPVQDLRYLAPPRRSA